MSTGTATAAEPTITRAGPRPARLLAWLAERHGPVLVIPVGLTYGIAVATGARSPGAAPVPTFDLVLGFVGAWLWFLALRIVDDLGDRESDDLAHPERLLQRGVVSLGELRAVAGVSLAAMLATTLLADDGVGPVTLTWLVAVVVTGLVSSDSIAPAALRARPMLHRLLRVPCSALPVLWWAQLGAGGTGLTSDAVVLALVSILIVVAFDVARKLEPAAGAGQTSWSDTLGATRAHAVLAGALAALGAACAALLAVTGAASTVALAVLAVAVVCLGAGIIRGNGKLAAPLLLVLLVTTLVGLVAA